MATLSPEWSRRAMTLVENNTEQLLLVLDPAMTVMWLSDGVNHVLGTSAEQHVGRSVNTLVHANDLHLVEMACRGRKSSPKLHAAAAPFHLRLKAVDGSWIGCQATVVGAGSKSDATREPAQIGDVDSIGLVITLQPVRTALEHAVGLLATDTALDDVLRALVAAVNESLPRGAAAIMIGSRCVDHRGPTQPWLSAAMVYDSPSSFAPRLIQDRGVLPHGGVAERISAASAWLVPITLPGESGPIGALIALNEVLDPSAIELERVLLPICRLSGIAALLHTSRAELQHLLTIDPVTGLPQHRRIEDWLGDLPGMDQIAVATLELMPLRGGSAALTERDADYVMLEVARRISSTLRPGDLVARGTGLQFIVVLRGIVARMEAERVTQRIRGYVERPIGVAGQIIDVGLDIGLELRRGGEDLSELLRRASSEMSSSVRMNASKSW